MKPNTAFEMKRLRDEVIPLERKANRLAIEDPGPPPGRESMDPEERFKDSRAKILSYIDPLSGLGAETVPLTISNDDGSQELELALGINPDDGAIYAHWYDPAYVNRSNLRGEDLIVEPREFGKIERVKPPGDAGSLRFGEVDIPDLNRVGWSILAWEEAKAKLSEDEAEELGFGQRENIGAVSTEEVV